MKLFNTTHYNEATLWMQKMQELQKKKQTLEQMSTSQAFEFVPTVSQAQGIVFTKDDLGHNVQETNLIREIYQELSTLTFTPALKL